MLVAVPLAAAMGVLIRFAMAQYRNSLLYQGVDGLPSEEMPDKR